METQDTRKIRNGSRPTRINHKDYDFFKNHTFGSVSPTTFQDEYFADAGLTMPNQDVVDTEFTPPTPPLPFGCTDFGSSDLVTDLTGKIHNPNDVEAITHANANSGCDIRVSLDACSQPTLLNPNRLGWFRQYFNIRTSGTVDYFDSFRVAQITGINVNEKRSITWGTPWFPSWENAARSGQLIMPMPTLAELQSVSSMPWHNSVLDGWSNRVPVAPGRELYRNKSWQGNQIGDRGFLYFPREVINTVMSISGTVAFTATNNAVQNPQTIDVSLLRWMISVLQGIIERYSK